MAEGADEIGRAGAHRLHLVPGEEHWWLREGEGARMLRLGMGEAHTPQLEAEVHTHHSVMGEARID